MDIPAARAGSGARPDCAASADGGPCKERGLNLGILGGTFDPVHNAHLAMAHAALREIPVDQVIWVPTGAPGYRSAPVASGAHRLAMLRLALAGEPRFSIDERELAPHASGYTVDTLRALRAERPADKLYLLIGGDQFAKFGAWREPEEIKRLAELAVFARPQAEAGPREALFVPMAPLAVSASEVRARAARGEDVSGLVPEPVANYLRRHRLYS